MLALRSDAIEIGSGEVRFGEDASPVADPAAWSPDGTKIAFTRTSPNREIYVMSADGTGQANLTNHAAADDSPSWSPDGTAIAFDSDRDGNLEIYVMNADGTGPVRLTNSPGLDIEPAWGIAAGPPPPPPAPQCSDGIDNDGDGRIDFPADPGCTSASDNDEFNVSPQCSDGIDNEMSLSHLAPNNVYEPSVEQMHIDGNKGLIYSQIASLLTEKPKSYSPPGKIGYVLNPQRIRVGTKQRTRVPRLPSQEDIEVMVPCQSANYAAPGSCDQAGVTWDADELALDGEKTLVFDDLRLDKKGQIAKFGGLKDRHNGREGNVRLINGTSEPEFTIAAGQIERWRIVNASSARYVRLSLGGLPFQIIGTDGGMRMPMVPHQK